MPNLFDEFDLELQKIKLDITPYSDSSSDSIAFCGGNSSSDPSSSLSNGPSCFNVCA